jgi:hypothetical protein
MSAICPQVLLQGPSLWAMIDKDTGNTADVAD